MGNSGFWLGVMQGMGEARQKDTEQQILANKDKQKNLASQYERLLEMATDEAKPQIMQSMNEVYTADPYDTKKFASAVKKLEQIPTTFIATQSIKAPVNSQTLNVPKMPLLATDQSTGQSYETPSGTGTNQVTTPYQPPAMQQVAPHSRPIVKSQVETAHENLWQRAQAFPMLESEEMMKAEARKKAAKANIQWMNMNEDDLAAIGMTGYKKGRYRIPYYTDQGTYGNPSPVSELASATSGQKDRWNKHPDSPTGWQVTSYAKDGSIAHSEFAQPPAAIAGSTSEYSTFVQSGDQWIETPMVRNTYPTGSRGNSGAPPPASAVPQTKPSSAGTAPSGTANAQVTPTNAPSGSQANRNRTFPMKLTIEEITKRAQTNELLRDLDVIEEQINKHPDAIGPWAGPAISAAQQKSPGFLTDLMESMGDMLDLKTPGQIRNPEVVDMYTRMLNIRMQLLYALSGKQINEKEYERLEKIIPLYNTDIVTTRSRLKFYRQNLQKIEADKRSGTWKWMPLSAKTKSLILEAGLPMPDEGSTGATPEPPSADQVPVTNDTPLNRLRNKF